MPVVSQVFGLVKAIHSGVSAPSNIKMLWYNENDNLHYYYNLNSSTWVPLRVDGGSVPYGVASGTDTYTVTVMPALNTLDLGQPLNIRFTNANSGASTLNANGTGVVAIINPDGSALVGGELIAGAVSYLVYNGTNYQLMGSASTDPGGSDTNVQINDNGEFYGDSGFTYNKTTKVITNTGGAFGIPQGTLTASKPYINHSATWNNVGVDFVGIFSNITNTASGANSLLMDLQVGGSSKLNLTPTGYLGINLGTIPTATIHAKGLTSDGTTSLLKLVNQSNSSLYSLTNDGKHEIYSQLGVNTAPLTSTTLSTVGATSTASTFAFRARNSALANIVHFRDDGQWGNIFDNLTDRWSHFSHSGTAAFGFVRDVTRTDAGNLTGYQINTYVQAGATTTALNLIPGDSVGGISYGIRSVGGIANQSFGAEFIGGAALISVGVTGSTSLTGGGIYSAGVIASNVCNTGLINYGLWANNQSTSSNTNYGILTEATATNSGTNIGIRAKASGGASNYALLVDINEGTIGFGTLTPHSSALVDVVSTTKGFRIPNMTTTQKNAISSPAKGLIVYDTTLDKACVYTTAWETITSS